MKILLTGGGTGGHLYPLLAVVEEIKKMEGVKPEILFVGPVSNFTKRILEKNGIKTKKIMAAKWRRYWSFENFLDIFKFPISLIQSLIYVLSFMPDVVFSKGGFGSVTPTLAARLYWIPILIHESDVLPGKANLWLGKIADKIAVSFESSKDYFKKRKVFMTGNPVRGNIQNGDPNKAIDFFQLRSDKPVLLIVGGSQGSKIINEKIVEILPYLLDYFQIIHQVGEGNLNEVKKEVGRKGIKIERSDYHPYEFLQEELIHAYRICDLVISRAGAGSITEIATVGKPSILIPLGKSAGGHQLYNAYEVAKRGGAFVIEESNLQKNILLDKINEVFDYAGLKDKMGRAMTQFYFPDSASKIAKALAYLAKVGDTKGAGLFEKNKRD